MALDPETRWLRPWESFAPCPPPVKGESDSRVEEAEERFRLFKERYSNIFDMLPLGINEPYECFELMYLSFCTDYYYQYSQCAGFLDWIYDPSRDYSFGYRYHKRALKILQWRCPPKRWSLKMPGHAFMIEGLNKVYPDARFIMTHRDPARVLPSVTKLIATMREDFAENARMAEFSAVQIDIWDRALHRLMHFRTRHDARFIDIYHGDLLEDSSSEINRLYEWLGWSRSKDLSDAIVNWRKSCPKRENPIHKEAAYFDIEELQRRFAFYNDRFAKW
jgi:hypothetical protein